MENLIGIDELSKILGIKRQSLCNRLSAKPESLPPYIRISTKIIRWKPSAISEWLDEREKKSAKELAEKIERKAKLKAANAKRRGRPTKKEQIQARA